MKKYLENLEKELKKLNIDDQEIAEILADHKEMIESAKDDGVSDEELVEKFGSPDKVAKELSADESHKDNVTAKTGEGELEGFELLKSFPAMDGLKSVSIELVSEDVLYFPYDGDYIEVYVKGLKNPDNYSVEYKNNELVVKRLSKGISLFVFKRVSVEFGIKVPMGELDSFNLKTVSSDSSIEGLNAKNVKIKSTSGDIDVSNLSSANTVAFSTVSGDIEVNGLKAEGLESSLVSGDFEGESFRLEDEININSVSGDVDLTDVKVNTLNYRTVSGDFEGEEVYCEAVAFRSVSGDFVISNSIHDEEIVVQSKKTVSGDFRIK